MGISYNRNHTWLPCDLQKHILHVLRPLESVAVSPHGKCFANLGRLRYRLLIIGNTHFLYIFNCVKKDKIIIKTYRVYLDKENKKIKEELISTNKYDNK